MLFLGLGAAFLALSLGAGWMVYMTKNSGLPGKSAGPAGPASPAASSPSTSSARPANTTPPQAPQPEAVASPVPTPPPASKEPAATVAQPGRDLVYCYQGKVPENRMLVVDKSRQRLMVLRYLGEMSLDFEYTCSTGMQEGSKKTEGDERTPEGIYFTTHRYEDNKISVFGDRAIHLNYPNPFDQYEKRDGNGIFIHGTDKTLKPRNSNGCVVLRNDELAVVANTIKEHYTPVMLVDQLRLAPNSERVKACQYLEKISLAALEEADSAVGNSLALKTGRAVKQSQQQELDELAARLANIGGNDSKLRVQTIGMGLYGLGEQWVVVAEQRIQGPNRLEIAVSRRFYLRGSDPLHAKLLSSHWVLDDTNQAKILASWAPPPKPAPVQVASVSPAPKAEAPQAPPAPKPEPVAVKAALPKPEPAPEHTTKTAPAVKPAPPKPEPAPVASRPTQTESAPAVRTQPSPGTPEEHLRATLSGWLRAWQSKNMSEYINYYAPEFRGDGMNRQAWQAHKTHLSRVYKVIGVEARDVRVTMLGTKARVTFVQHYRSDGHRDVGRKHLDLVLKGGHWKIVSERWEALPGRADLAGHGKRS